jgi:hypothetical protein
MAIESRFRQTLVIHRLTPGDTVDARGNREDTYEADEAIRGLVQRRSPSEIRGSDPAGVGISDAEGFLPIAITPPGPADYIQEGSSIYQMLGPARDAGARGRHLEADLYVVVP